MATAREDQRTRVAGALVGGVVALGIVGIAGAFLLTRPRPEPAPVAPAVPPPAAVEAPPAEEPTVAAPRSSPRRSNSLVAFPGRVTAVSGRDDVKIGDACQVLVDAYGPPVELEVGDVTITCGGHQLHQMTDRGTRATGGQTHALKLVDAGIADRTWSLRYQDVGPRSADARPEAVIDSDEETGRVFSSQGSPMEVRLQVDRLGRRTVPSRPRIHVRMGDDRSPIAPPATDERPKRPKVVVPR